MTELPTPPAGPELDLRHFPWMRIDITRLKNSNTWIKARPHPAARGVMLSLWVAAWHQVPAGSLPNDDDLIRHFADVPADTFKVVRELAMSGFILHSDDRFYHPVLVEIAIESLMTSLTRKSQAKKAATKRWDDYRAKNRKGNKTAADADGDATAYRDVVLEHMRPDDVFDAIVEESRGEDRRVSRAPARPPKSIEIMDNIFDEFAWHGVMSLQNASMIQTWLNEGSTETEILDTVIAVTRRKRERDPNWSPGSWSYFTGPMRASRQSTSPDDHSRQHIEDMQTAVRLKAFAATGTWLDGWGPKPKATNPKVIS